MSAGAYYPLNVASLSLFAVNKKRLFIRDLLDSWSGILQDRRDILGYILLMALQELENSLVV